MPRRIFILVGHPDTESFNRELAESYAFGAKERGYEVKVTNLGDLSFDPILHKGYRVHQKLEPDLIQIQENIKWCEHFVIFYPSWWSTMPALLKGMFDRIWLPDFAFKFSQNGLWWQGLLKGRTARIFVTSDAHPIFTRIIFGDTTNEIRKGTLWFAGFSVSVKKIGVLKNISEKKKAMWLGKMKRWGSGGY
jgi:putative NADPH-quinone reductase